MLVTYKFYIRNIMHKTQKINVYYILMNFFEISQISKNEFPLIMNPNLNSILKL